jgi:hypothetical protein
MPGRKPSIPARFPSVEASSFAPIFIQISALICQVRPSAPTGESQTALPTLAISLQATRARYPFLALRMDRTILGNYISDDGTLDGVSGTVAASLFFHTTRAYTLPPCRDDCSLTVNGTFSGILTAYADNPTVPYEIGNELWSVEITGQGVADLYYPSPTPGAFITVTSGTAVPTVPEPGSVGLLALAAIGVAGMLLRARRRVWSFYSA